jgi:positive regulator of sigma E activity
LHDWVEIGIPEATMVRGAFLLYILPLLLALTMALITQTWLNELLQTGEGAVIVMTLLGGAAGFVLANRLLRQSDLNEPQQAKLLKVLANNALAIPIQEVDSH